MKKQINQTTAALKAKRIKTTILSGIIALGLVAASAHAYFEQQNFWSPTSESGGILSFEDTASQTLQMTIDNTSNFSAIITGMVFNITGDIEDAALLSVVDGNGNNITSSWEVLLDINNSITPGRTTFDVGFNTSAGINGGIYNNGTASNTNNAFPDIATLTLQIDSPTPWIFTDVMDDSILRTQRTGANGEGIDTIATSSSSGTPVPEPGILMLLAIGLLGQAYILRRRWNQ